MSFTSASNDRTPSRHPSHLPSSVEPQQLLYLDHQDTLYPNFEDTRLDGPRLSVTLPNPDSFLASPPQVPRDPDQNDHPSSSHLPFTIGGSSQSQGFGLSGTTPSYLFEGPHAVSATDATTLYQTSYPPSCRCIAHPTIPSAGPSRFGGGQPTPHSWNNIAQPGLVMVAPAPTPALAPPPSTSLPLQPFNSDPREFPPFPAAPSTQAQALDIPNVTGWPCSPGGRTPTSTRGPRSRHRAPLVRVEDQVEWVRPRVLKVTLWLNWSPNAEAEAHDPWD
ncbi:hypothetical protein V8E53_014855 [Lactarius tabidus]